MDNCPSCKVPVQNMGQHLEFAHQEEVVLEFSIGEIADAISRATPASKEDAELLAEAVSIFTPIT